MVRRNQIIEWNERRERIANAEAEEKKLIQELANSDIESDD